MISRILAALALAALSLTAAAQTAPSAEKQRMIDLGIEHKILEKKGAWISYEGSLIGQGRDAAKQALKEKPELAEKIQRAILEKVNIVGGATVTGEASD